MEPVTKPVVVKQGKLSKLGGGGGGHKNWRDRWFVLRYSVSQGALAGVCKLTHPPCPNNTVITCTTTTTRQTTRRARITWVSLLSTHITVV